MSLWNTFKQWRRRDADLDEEIRAHLSRVEQDRVERGESPKDAALAAHREFGNPLLVTEATRGVWGWAAVERSFQDLKYAFRQMRRSPGFTLIAILTLALGLGATTAMFSIVNGVLLTPLKLPEPDRLYMAQTIVAPRFKANGPWPVNARHFHEWRTHGQSWEQIALVSGMSGTLTGTGEPQRVLGLGVSHNFLKTLRIQPTLGRDFRPEEELPGNSNVVILSDSLWQNRFASASSIVGQSILLDGVPHLVIGIIPELRLPNIRNPKILRPLGFDVSQARAYGQYNFYSVVRLKPGVQPQAAISEMNALIADLVREFIGHALEERDRDRRVAVVSERVARTLWPDQNPIGRHVMSCGSVQSDTLEVVGVVGEARADAEQEPPLTIYQPYWDIPMGGGSFVLRTKADPSTVTGALHKLLRSLDSDLPIAPAQTMVQVLDESVAPRRFEMYLAVAFAAAALVLASFGIYGIVSFTVARRTPEIGIRLALGAEPRQLVAMVLRQGLSPVVGGLAVGLIGALGIGRFLASQLFGVSPSDPLTISIVTMLLLVVAVGACLIPARRAIRIDPVRALRFE